MDSSQASPPRRAHEFQPGKSGNPAGRVKGIPNRMTRLAREIVEKNAEDIMRAVARQAIEGDPVAMKLMVDRILPLRRGAPIEIELPPIDTAADVPNAVVTIINAVSDGVISAEEGEAVAGIVEVGRKAIETADIEARLASLEAQNVR